MNDADRFEFVLRNLSEGADIPEAETGSSIVDVVFLEFWSNL